MVTRQAGKAPPPPPLAQSAPAPIAGVGDTGPSDLKRQLLWRMGLAGLMILALLAALAVFDAVNSPDEPVAPQFSEPVPVRKRELVQALTPAAAPAEAPAEAPAAVPVPAEPEASAAPLDRSRTAVALVPRSEGIARPVPPPPAAASPKAPASGGVPAAGDASPAAPRPATGYAWQSSVFPDLARAEEVQAKLAQEGIPASVETRLRVGPFRSRAEAEAARRKLKALGLDALTLVGPGGKP